MLGGLLTQQAEEEERRLREAAVQQQQQQQHDRAGNKIVSATITAGGGVTPSSSSSSVQRNEDDLHQSIMDGEGSSDYDDDDDDDDDDDIMEGASEEDDEVESYSEDDEDGSSAMDHDDNENSYLLGGSEWIKQRRRRRRRWRQGEEELGKEQASPFHYKSIVRKWKRSMHKLGSKLRSVVSAIADVDNVWDSPDDCSDQHYLSRHHRRAGVDSSGAANILHTSYGTGSSSNYSIINNNNNGNNFNSTDSFPDNRASTILCNIIVGGTTTRNRTAAIVWFIVLSSSYAFERSTFKLLVDRVGPFRLFSAELILGSHALLTALGMAIGRMILRNSKDKKEIDNNVLMAEMRKGFGDGVFSGLPLADVALMAVLDTVYLLLGVISGAHVPPVLTVVLVQATIPLTACFTQCVHPDGLCIVRRGTTNECEESPSGNNSAAALAASHSNVRIRSSASTLNEMDDITVPDFCHTPTPQPVKGWGGLSIYHIIGTGLMFLAIFLGLTPAVLSLVDIIITKKDAMPIRTAYNTIVFCLAAIPAAVSQLYKEHTLTRLRQPIDRNSLNLVLSIFQLLFAIVISPLAYGLQGMGDGVNWTSQYSSSEIGVNFSHGLACFIGTLDEETMTNGYPEVAVCRWSGALVFLHVLSIIMVGVAIDKLAAATKVMYRGVSMGIILAVILMFWYQFEDKWSEYGRLVSFFHLTSTIVLIVGAEIYHRVSLESASFETIYPKVRNLYDEEES